MYKRKIFYFISSILLFLCSCSDFVQIQSVIKIDLKENGHKQHLAEYDSPYTLAYLNQDNTYTLYIFAAPIQFQEDSQYYLIDNSLIKSDNELFLYENKKGNIKSYFPASLNDPFLIKSDSAELEFKVMQDVSDYQNGKRKVYTNIYGDKVDAIFYANKTCDMVFYPTRAGIQMEIVYKDDPMKISFESDTCYTVSDNQNGYYVLEDFGTKMGILYQPLVYYSDKGGGRISTQSNIQVSKHEGRMIITYSVNNDDTRIPLKSSEPIILSTSFELYSNKLPDSSVYSNKDKNMYLKPYALVGVDSEYGEGWHYVRSRFRYYSESIKPSMILSCTYNTYLLSGGGEVSKISAYKMEEQWSSTGIVWNNRERNFSNCLSIGVSHNRLLSFDMTELAKNSMRDIEMFTESTGFLLKKDNLGPADIIATSDNAEYIPYFRLELTDLPHDFLAHENINPQNGVL